MYLNFNNLNLSPKIIGSITAVLFLLLSFGVTLIFQDVQAVNFKDLKIRCATLVDALHYTFEALLDDDHVSLDKHRLSHLQELVDNMVSIEDVEKVLILEPNGQVLVSSDSKDYQAFTLAPQTQAFLRQPQKKPQTFLSAADELVTLQAIWGKQQSSPKLLGIVEVRMQGLGEQMEAQEVAWRMLGLNLGGYLLLAGVLWLGLHTQLIKPIKLLVNLMQRFQAGEHTVRCQLNRTDELGLLARTFDNLADELVQLVKNLEGHVAAKADQNAKLASMLAELQATVAERSQLAVELKKTAIPLIKLYPQVILVPLIGNLDGGRAHHFQTLLLQGVEKQQARKVILDLTGAYGDRKPCSHHASGDGPSHPLARG